MSKQMKHAKDSSQSFYDWASDNQGEKFITFWDYEKNDIDPENIARGSHKKMYFKCERGLHESKAIILMNITSGRSDYDVICDKCKSIAQWGIDNICDDFLEKYWDYEKNTESPWNIMAHSTKKIYIYCQICEYHGSYEVVCGSFSQNCRCPYCAGFKVHREDSFAKYHINNTDRDFLKRYWGDKNKIDPFTLSVGTNTKVWIKCTEIDYHEEYLVKCSYFTAGARCSYCGKNGLVDIHDSVGYIHPESFELWSDKNDLSPNEYRPGSDKKVYWKCENGIHEDYLRKIGDSKRCNFRCPICVRERKESILQEKVRLYIFNELKYDLLHEYNCVVIATNPNTGWRMPYDNEIVDLKLIVEVMGKQHYSAYFHRSKFCLKGRTPEESFKDLQWRDEYKKQYALSNGYEYLAIPYTADDSQETYKTLIDNKIAEIKNLK